MRRGGYRPQNRRRNKYNARPTGRYASRAEAKRLMELRMLSHCGYIEDLVEHPHYEFVVNGRKVGRGYTADAAYYRTPAHPDYIPCSRGRRIVEEIKGCPARDWPLRRDLFLALYPDVCLLVNGKEHP